MQRIDAEKPARAGGVGRCFLCAVVFAIVAGCGGASDSPSAASQSAADPAPPISNTIAPPTAGSGTNAPASISGTPGTQVQSGQAYSFSPAASDPDGDLLTFSVQNKPSWASFSASSGQLTGTPASAQVGSYSNIVISVSDRTSRVSLAPFSITVTAEPSSTGSASLSWVPPTSNTDGSPLSNLTGYRIDYGTSAGSLTQTLTISDPTATSHTLQGLASGTWFFAVSDFTSAGTVSVLSSVVSKTIQ